MRGRHRARPPRRRRLPTPPEPHVTTISFAASSASSDPEGVAGRAIRTRAPRRALRRSASWPGGPCRARTARHVEVVRRQARALRARSRGRAAPVRRQPHRELGGVEHARRGSTDRSHERAWARARRRSNNASSPRPNSSGSTRFTTTAARSTDVLLAVRCRASSIASVTGISAGFVTMTTPVRAGSFRMSSIQRV